MGSRTYRVKDYYTRIKNDGSVFSGGNEYVLGVIMGIMLSVCVEYTDDDFLTKLCRNTTHILKDNRTGDAVYRVRTTHELYDAFMSIVERYYPGICEFDIFD